MLNKKIATIAGAVALAATGAAGAGQDRAEL